VIGEADVLRICSASELSLIATLNTARNPYLPREMGIDQIIGPGSFMRLDFPVLARRQKCVQQLCDGSLCIAACAGKWLIGIRSECKSIAMTAMISCLIFLGQYWSMVGCIN
jgi:hypothetical protein